MSPNLWFTPRRAFGRRCPARKMAPANAVRSAFQPQEPLWKAALKMDKELLPRVGKYDRCDDATSYDLMAEGNPAYQEILEDFGRTITHWRPAPGEILADFGAGTGNFSLALAAALPACRVWHLESDDGLNRRALQKAHQLGLANLEIRRQGMPSPEAGDELLAGIVSVHGIYTQPEPGEFLARLCRCLRPGGYAYLCDAGRYMDLRDWATFLLRENVRTYRTWTAARALWQGRVPPRVHRIDHRQRQAYWLHSHGEFLVALEEAGFQIEHHRLAYRGYSDIAVCRKR